jgi:hypothetical protein
MLQVGALIDVKTSETADPVRGTITKVVDQSMYTVG